MKALHWLALAVAVVTPGASRGRDRATAAAAAARRAAIVAALPRGAAFASGGERYRLVGGLRAVRRAARDSEAQALARAGVAAAEVVERKGRAFLLVRAAAAPTATVPRPGPLLAVNERTGGLGVVSGVLEVGLRDGADPAAVAARTGLALVSAAPRLRLAFLRVAAGGDLLAAAAAVGRDPAVESVEIEVLEQVVVPH